MATQDNTLNNNPAWGTTPSSSTIQTGFTGTSRLGGASERIRQAAMSDVLSAGAGSADAPYAEGLRQLEAQKATAITQKQLAGLGAIQSIGDLHDQIYENQRKRLEAQATSGFVGGGQGLRGNLELDKQISTSENTIQRNLLNAVRQGNISLDQLTNQELQTLAATGAMSKELSNEIVRRGYQESLDRGKATPYAMWEGRASSQDGGAIGGGLRFIFGGGFDNYRKLIMQKDAVKNSPYFQELFKQLGVDVNNPQILDRVAEQMANTYTQHTHGSGYTGRTVSDNIADVLKQSNLMLNDGTLIK